MPAPLPAVLTADLVLTDLDGTAIGNDGTAIPSTRVVEVVAAAQARGVQVAAVTGRPWSNAGPVIEALGITTPSVISGGTQLVDPTTGTILHETCFTARAWADVLDIAATVPAELLVRDELTGTGRPADSHDRHTPANVAYLMTVLAADAADAMALLEAVEGIHVAAVTSWTPDAFDIHVTPGTASKAGGVKRLLELLGVDAGLTIGIGDADNDLALFDAAGTGIAMGNASPALLARADHVTGTVTDDGLADVLDRCTPTR